MPYTSHGHPYGTITAADRAHRPPVARCGGPRLCTKCAQEAATSGEVAVNQVPLIGDTVHYVSYGTPGGEYPSTCRAAIVTAVDTYQNGESGSGLHIGHVSLCVLNPEGQFFNRAVQEHDGAAQPGSPNCPNAQTHGNPFRYCACGWIEPALKGGTWHRREECPA